MSATRAIVLFAHGARDARWAQPLERLKNELVRMRPGTRVHLAFLELQEPTLGDALAMLTAEGLRTIDIAPIFWSKGGHIVRDLPGLIGAFTANHPGVSVRVLPVLAELPGMDEFIARAILAQFDPIESAPRA